MDTPISEIDPLHNYTAIQGFNMLAVWVLLTLIWQVIGPMVTPYIQTAIAYIVLWALTARLGG